MRWMSHHVKNIFLYNWTNIENVTCTDTYTISANDLQNSERSVLMSTMSSDLLFELIGESVRVNRGGPESQKGTVVAVYSDYFVLLSENGTFFYYQLHHIKSITKNAKDMAEAVGCLPLFAEGDDFQELLQNLKYRWVKINRGGPEKIEGILQDVSSKFVTLIVKEEVVQISHYHIKSMNYGLQVQEDESEQDNQSSNNQQSRARSKRRSNRS